ncbi:hypothetical protein ABPG72_000263 [Tetrahymena utriculariae]
MERYKIIETISDQEYGTIAKAINIQNKQRYIVKILRKKFYTWQECIQVREVKALRLFSHPNIIKIKELIKQRDELICVYEYYEKSLFDYYQEMRDLCDEFSERQIKEIMFQIISAITYMHDQKFFHRDLCPETISVNTYSSDLLISSNIQVKISSFTVTREISQRFAPYTDYITTRWYRAPEQLVHSNSYTHKVDIWAIGCILAELYLMGPLFNGISEQDQLLRIMKVFGTPSQQDCPELFTYASNMKFQFPQMNPTNLSKIFPNASAEALDLMKQIFKYNPLHRLSCDQLLKHPFFSELNKKSLPKYNTPSNIIQKMQKKQDFEEYYESIKEQIDSEKNSAEKENLTELQNSQKKSKFSQNQINPKQENDEFTPSNGEDGQQQFSHFFQKHLEQNQELEQHDLDRKSNYQVSEINSLDNTGKNQDFTPSS